jgi:transposase InsO family protein
MGQVLHKRATTTHRIRAEIQQSSEKVAEIAHRLGVNPKTVRKWRKRASVEDAKMGPRKLRTVLTPLEEEMICALRRKALLALDDCYIALKPSIPALTRSNLHRCLVRHGLSVLPKELIDKPQRERFSPYPIGYFHVDICEVRTGERKVYLYVAVDRISKFVVAEVHTSPTIKAAVGFLQTVVEAVPHKIHRVLTDNGVQFTYNLILPKDRPRHEHPFDAACTTLGIKHKTTKFRHPWTNGQVERTNRTLKEATSKTYHYETVDQFKSHLFDFLMAYNFQRKLKALRFTTPYEKIQAEWKLHPALFHSDPDHYLLGRNT